MYIKRTVHFALIIAFLILFVTSMRIMRFYANTVENIHFGNEKILDLRFGYTLTDVNKYLAFLNAEGKNVYLNRFYLIDSIYPVIYAAFYIFSLSLLINICFPKTRKTYGILLLPVIGAIFDYSENFFIKSFLKDINKVNEFNVNISSIFTRIKFISIYTTFALILVFILIFVIKIFRNDVEWQK